MFTALIVTHRVAFGGVFLCMRSLRFFSLADAECTYRSLRGGNATWRPAPLRRWMRRWARRTILLVSYQLSIETFERAADDADGRSAVCGRKSGLDEPSPVSCECWRRAVLPSLRGRCRTNPCPFLCKRARRKGWPAKSRRGWVLCLGRTARTAGRVWPAVRTACSFRLCRHVRHSKLERNISPNSFSSAAVYPPCGETLAAHTRLACSRSLSIVSCVSILPDFVPSS